MLTLDGAGRFSTGDDVKDRRDFRDEMSAHPLTVELGKLLGVYPNTAADVAYELNEYLGKPFFLKIECVTMAIKCKDLSGKILLLLDEEIPF